MNQLTQNRNKPERENILLSLLLNIIIPVIILTKFSDDKYLGNVAGLLIALSFPLFYGIFDFFKRKKVNFISILGIISLLLTGGIGLLELPPKWIAIKEAGVPLIIGIYVLASLKTRYPLVRTMIYNDVILNVDKVHESLAKKNNEQAFETKLVHVSYLLSASFFLSAILNYVLAKVIVVSDPGSTAFNEELGQMMVLSYPVIVAPSMVVMVAALWYLFKSIHKLTGLKLEDIIHH